jgi:DNA-binding SARP family transcriptional activator
VSRVATLYGGSFLAQLDASWATPLRMRLRAKFMRRVTEQARALLAAGQYAAAIAVFERGLEVDPQLEELYYGLMLCHSAQGRRADAIGVYQRCEKILMATVGVAPGTRTVALYQTLLEREPQN